MIYFISTTLVASFIILLTIRIIKSIKRDRRITRYNQQAMSAKIKQKNKPKPSDKEVIDAIKRQVIDAYKSKV